MRRHIDLLIASSERMHKAVVELFDAQLGSCMQNIGPDAATPLSKKRKP